MKYTKTIATLLLVATMIIIGFEGNFTVKANVGKGVVSIAFDDGCASQYDNAFPLMAQHNFTGTYYIISSFVGSDGYMNITQLKALQAGGNEIASHSVDHPNFLGLTDDQINYECNASQQFLWSNGFPAKNFAYPYGEDNNHTDSIVLQYYRSARHSYGPDFLMSTPPTAIQMATPMGFAGETGDANALAQDEYAVDLASSTNSWVLIFFHNIFLTPPTNPWQIQQTDFASLLNYIASSGVQVMTVDQALNKWSPSYRVTALPSVAAMDVGQSQIFTASAYGGKTPYKYQWSLNGNAVGTNSPSYSFNPSTAGSYSLYVNATDNSLPRLIFRSNNVSITVNPALATPFVASDVGVVDQGQNSSLNSTTITTGTSPYSYQWLQETPSSNTYTAINGATNPNYTFATSTTTTPGNWKFLLQITDAAGETVNSNEIPIMVNTAPTANASPSSIKMDIEQTQMFSASPSGGSGSYTSYLWYVNGVSQPEAKGITFAFSPSSANIYSLTVAVVDSLGCTSAQSTAATIKVSDLPTVSVMPVSPLAVDVGQVQTFTAVPNGGSGVIHYRWYLDGSAVGIDSSSYSCVATGIPYSITCEVTDSAFVPVTSHVSNTVLVTVNPALVAPSVVSISGVVDQGQNSSLNSTTISTGTSPYTYQWLQETPSSNTYTPINGATNPNYTFATSTTTTPGNWKFKLLVEDATGANVTSNIISVTVNTAPTANISYSASTMNVGQSQVFTSTVSGGTGPYSYQWYLNGALVSGATSLTFTFTASSAGLDSIYMQVKDSASIPAVVSSNTAAVLVNSALSAPNLFASANMVNPGQTISLTSSSVSTGTGPYSYLWLSKAPGEHTYSTISGATFGSFNFVTSGTTVAGSWSFIIEVKDNLGISVNSSAATVMVNPVISVSAGAGGNISPSGNVIVNYGDNQNFIISADDGYNILDVTVDGNSVGAVNSYAFSNVQAPQNISVTFAPKPTPTPTATPTPTSDPTATPTPTTTSTPTPDLTASPKQTQSNIPKEAIYGMTLPLAAIAIGGIVTVLRKSKKDKS